MSLIKNIFEMSSQKYLMTFSLGSENSTFYSIHERKLVTIFLISSREYFYNLESYFKCALIVEGKAETLCI